MAEFVRNLGAMFKDRREELELSAREVARRAGVAHSFILKIERGECCPSILSLFRISDALGVDAGHILERMTKV